MVPRMADIWWSAITAAADSHRRGLPVSGLTTSGNLTLHPFFTIPLFFIASTIIALHRSHKH